LSAAAREIGKSDGQEDTMVWSVGAGLEGKGVIVTGATGGIGRACAEAFAMTGAKVMAVDLDQAKVDEVVAGFEGTGHVGVAWDLRDISKHDALIARAREELPNLYVLANIAAVLRRRGSLDEVTEEDWDFQHDINLKAAFFLARAAGRAMIEQGNGGRIILFSSQGWWTGGFGGSVAYAATKGGITSACRGLARTFGPHRITVNCVSPGQVHTPMLMTGLSPEIYEGMKKQTPLGYVAEPVEMAGPVVFLASDHASYITGSTINASGGFLMY
jgi:NAD(P)-dependent dehydrogenase (short-subunit alcohol dehydrogenase family)